jgi:hypothetical protein
MSTRTASELTRLPGARAAERAAMRRDVSCKENYAVSVKKIMPQRPRPVKQRWVTWKLIHLKKANDFILGPRLGLTERNSRSIIIFTYKTSYAQEIAARPQDHGPSATALLESSSRTGHRRTVSDSRVLRCPRPCSGQVRNGAPGRSRGSAGEPIGSRLWVLPALVLPGASKLPTGWPAGSNAPEAGPQTSSQAYRRGARIYPRSSSGRSIPALGGPGFAHPGPLWRHGSSTQHRTRFGAQSKKTVVNEMLLQSAAAENWTACYEQLRQGVLGQATGGGFGLIVFLRQGMAAWMRACAVPLAAAPTGASVPPLDAVSSLPGDVRSQAAVILAGILLHYSTEPTLCKATCTR